MRRLSGRADGDRGAVTVLVAVLLSVALIGLGALTVDVGSWYSEQAQLQNGADSAALAVAQTCVQSAGCATGPAAGYADSNAADGTTAVDAVCGSGPNLSSCGNRPCPGAPAAYPSAPYVDVETSTRTANGATHLPALLGRWLEGSSWDGPTVGACSQVAWGSPPPTDGLALTISYCAWRAAVGSPPTNYASPPPYPPYPPASDEFVFFFHGNAPGTDTQDPTCQTPGSSGAFVPGGFGHTCEQGAANCSQTGTSCTTDLGALPGGWYQSDTGNTIDSVCQPQLQSAWTSHQPLLLPVFDCVSSVSGCLQQYPCSSCGTSGNNAAYHLQGLAAFVITAFHVQTGSNSGDSKKDEPSWLPGSPYASNPPCSGSATCIAGFFTTAETTGSLGSGTDYGVTTFRLTG